MPKIHGVKVAPTFAQQILWAVDPFHESPNQQLKLGKALPLLFGKNVSILPVSVLHPGRYNPEQEIYLETWRELAGAAQKNLDKLLSNSKISNLEAHRCILQDGTSIQKAVATLLKFAIEERVDLIAVSSHARKGASRILLGSFAETLVLHSPIPVLVVNPSWQPKKKIKHIIFPTDFSDASNLAYVRTLKLAKALGAEVLLFHKTQAVPVTYGIVVPPMGKRAMKEVLRQLHEKGEAWSKMGQNLGVNVKFYLSDRPGYALNDILKTAKRHPGATMVAMASQSGSLETILMGSLTRQVLRNSPCPVLTLHPHQEKLIERVVESIKRLGLEYSAHPMFG